MQTKQWELTKQDFRPVRGYMEYLNRTSDTKMTERLHAFPRAIALALYNSTVITLAAAPLVYAGFYLSR